MLGLAQLVVGCRPAAATDEQRRSVALQEVANQAERIAALSWDDTSAGQADELAAFGRADCGDSAAVVPRAGQPTSRRRRHVTARRIRLEIVWPGCRRPADSAARPDGLETSPGGPAMIAFRRGKTLIELMVVLTLASGVLACARRRSTNLFRVRDRSSAATASSSSSPAAWPTCGGPMPTRRSPARSVRNVVFTLADGQTVHYSFAGPADRREVRRGDAILHRDSFPLPAPGRRSPSTSREEPAARSPCCRSVAGKAATGPMRLPSARHVRGPPESARRRAKEAQP